MACTVSCLTLTIQKPQEINHTGVAPQRWQTTVLDNESNSQRWKRSHTHTFSWWEPSLLPDPPTAVFQLFPLAFCQLLPWTDFQLSPLDYLKYWPLTDCFQSWNVLMSHCVSQTKRLTTVGVCCYFLSGAGNGDTQTGSFATTDATANRTALWPFRCNANGHTHTLTLLKHVIKNPRWHLSLFSSIYTDALSVSPRGRGYCSVIALFRAQKT